jgi:hypothetical protein
MDDKNKLFGQLWQQTTPMVATKKFALINKQAV